LKEVACLTLVLWFNSANVGIVAVHHRDTYNTLTADQVIPKTVHK